MHIFKYLNSLLSIFLISTTVLSCESNGRKGPVDKYPIADIVVEPSEKEYTIEPEFFGVCPMFWLEDDAAMADGKIEQHLKDMKCGFLRFPGGTESDNFIWNTNKLHDIRRWPNLDGMDKMTTDKFIALCQRLQAEPIICVNTEIAIIENNHDKAAQLAAEWVKYCNVTNNYNVKYWEIGNEPYYHYRFTPTEYAQLLIKMAREMKKVDPSIKIAAVGEWNYMSKGQLDMVSPDNRALATQMEWSVEINDGIYSRAQLDALRTYNNGMEWWPEMLSIAGEHIDVASIHWYYNENELTEMTATLDKLTSLIKSKVSHDVELIMTEWTMHEYVEKYGMDRALSVGEAIGRALDGNVKKTTYWPLRCGGIHDKKGLIDMTPEKGTHANMDVMKLFANNIGDCRVKSSKAVSNLYNFASIDENSGRIQVFLINRSASAVSNTLTVKGVGKKTVTVKLLDSQGNQSNDKPVLNESSEEYNGEKMSVSIPPYSMAVYIF